MIHRQLHLVISVFIVFAVAFIYGFQPAILFDVHISSTDEHNVFKAVMGLYVGFSTLWIIGILKPSFWKLATITNLVFMWGLAFGRIVSIFIDGIPSQIFLFGTFGEVILGCYAFFQFKRFSDSIK